MVSNRLTDNERESILFAAKQSIQRPREFFKFPLSLSQVGDLYYSRFPSNLIAAYKILLVDNHVVPSQLARAWETLKFVVGRETMQVHIRAGAALFFQTGNAALARTLCSPMDLALAEKALDASAVRALVQWGHDTRAAMETGMRSLAALYRVLEIANTMGQFARMVPDLVPLVSSHKQTAILEQEKASPPPPEWAATPREPVDEMLLHIARCNLMTPVEYRTPGDAVYSVLGYKESEETHATW